jgi:hypothetical protein
MRYKYKFHINDFSMIPYERAKKQNPNNIEINSKFFLSADKSKAFVHVDTFAFLVGDEVYNPVINRSRMVDISLHRQKEFLKKWGFKPVKGSEELNQRYMPMSNHFVFVFDVTNKNKLRSFIARKSFENLGIRH